MTTYLTIDTSAAISVGVVRSELGQQTILCSAFSDETRHHAEKLTPMIQQTMREAGVVGVDAVIAGTGPGAFTGLRAGLVTARTLARAWNIPLYGVSSLDVIALAAADRGANEIVSIVDARRKELFVQRCRPMGPDDVEVTSGPKVLKPDALEAELAKAPAVIAASDEDLYPQVGSERMNVTLDPAVMVRLAQSRLHRIEAGEELSLDTEPQYLRRPDVHGGAHSQPAAQGNPYSGTGA